jgi:hypothetical protein
MAILLRHEVHQTSLRAGERRQARHLDWGPQAVQQSTDQPQLDRAHHVAVLAGDLQKRASPLQQGDLPAVGGHLRVEADTGQRVHQQTDGLGGPRGWPGAAFYQAFGPRLPGLLAQLRRSRDPIAEEAGQHLSQIPEITLLFGSGVWDRNEPQWGTPGKVLVSDLSLNQSLLLETVKVKPHRIGMQADITGQLVHPARLRRPAQSTQNTVPAGNRPGGLSLRLRGCVHLTIVSPHSSRTLIRSGKITTSKSTA